MWISLRSVWSRRFCQIGQISGGKVLRLDGMLQPFRKTEDEDGDLYCYQCGFKQNKKDVKKDDENSR